MKTAEGLYSVRIVVADFYMHRPITDLDPAYSDFRGHEIKSLPVIRIFGSQPDGEKVCMHVHGVFPYFYVPYVDDIAPDADQLAYQIAANLDKAINISLGQTHAQTQHVFKIQLVKGRPFYGYHHKEHQFLKIFLYNPRFIKKAANLLLNGAILGKSFQPHESHVPYILQFFIDYNLYGMSLLHVPREIVKYRQSDEYGLPEKLGNDQILSQKIIRVSTSRFEVDVAAAFILNRFQQLNQDNGNTNPGIETIWQDERIRRKKLSEEQEVPPLEMPPSQERLLARPTESDIFYQAALRAKLATKNIPNDSINLSSANNTTVTTDRKKKFNLVELLKNSVYPSECSQELNASLANASKIPDHLSSNSAFHSSMRDRSKSRSSISTDASFVDEDLVLSLSQPQQKFSLDQTLQAEDLELLDVMQRLEENEEDVDLDSTLAPLSQIPKSVTLQNIQCDNNDNSIEKLQYDSSDDDNNDMNDYTISMDSVDKILMELSQPKMTNEKIPQLDGADDFLSTPKKRRVTKNSLKTNRSPKSPKIISASKYQPLNVTINQSPLVKATVVNDEFDKILKITPVKVNSNGQLQGAITPTKVRWKPTLLNLDGEFKINLNNNNINGKLRITDEKSFIVCNLKSSTPSKRSIVIENIKTSTTKSSETTESSKCYRLKKCQVKLKRLHDATPIKLMKIKQMIAVEERNLTNLNDDDSCLESLSQIKTDSTIQENETHYKDVRKETSLVDENSNQECANDKMAATRESVSVAFDQLTKVVDRAGLDANGFVKPKIRAVEVKNEIWSRRRSWSPTEISHEYDRQNNYFPQAGPSGIKKNKKRTPCKSDNIKQPSTSRMQTRFKTKQEKQCESISEEEIVSQTPEDDNKEEIDSQTPEDDNKITSFNGTLVFDSPSIFGDDLSPQTPKIVMEEVQSSIGDSNIHSIIPPVGSQLAVITPRNHPPAFLDSRREWSMYNFPDEVFPEPFYSDDADVSMKREVGHHVLHIPGKSLISIPDFQSIIPNLKGINSWRKNVLDLMLGENVTKDLENPANVKEYLSCQERMVISTKSLPPSKKDADQWLCSVAVNKDKDQKQDENEEDDSPIKVRKEKVRMIFDESTLNNNGDDCDLSVRSISLSPLTPNNINVRKTTSIQSSTKSNVVTPANNISAHETPLSALYKFKERRKSRARMSLAKKMQRLGSVDSVSSGTESDVSKSTMKKEAISNAPCITIDDSNDSEKCSGVSLVSEQINNLCSDKVRQVLERTSFIRNLSVVESCGGSDVSFGLSGVTLENTFGFKINLENFQNVKADVELNHLTLFSLELHVNTREELKPDPQFDAINCLFFSISNDFKSKNTDNQQTGCIMVCDDVNPFLNGVDTQILPVKSEMELFERLLQLCHQWDPDILVGYEIEMNSWGYLIDRAKVLGMNLKALLSRVPTQRVREEDKDDDRETFTDLDIELKLCGRILLDVWRLMRSEIALTSYTFENVMFHILHRRCPLHRYQDLTTWFITSSTRWIVLEYYMERINGTVELLEQLDLIGRTSEMAKLIGIQFYEVLSRGSQFRVESMMLRIAKPKNFVPISPSIQQRAHSRAPEYLSLILEPKSRFYADPMIVLDFQSLYPSIIIAYNYCFSTCLGRVEHLGQSAPFEFGCSQLRVSESELNRLIEKDLVTISPCGVVFVKKEVREGVLPRMLKEILETRIMVKQSMKLHKTNATLQRVLHSRQLGLKLMANVTYGYTSANFSGRMACVEVADSVVAKGRETLERAIKMVEANKEWQAKVVYGDTDSLFVLVPGRSRADAFRIGEEIVEAVTNDNPQPMKLKLEKVYQPCILQTKKRYVGFMYESADQENPEYEAKGIETVRRDGCPAVAKILEKCLRILFETCDVSQIKRYVCRQFTKLLTGNANVQDLIFAKEFRGKNGYKPGACVPALELTRKWLQTDPRSEPRRGQRVPFLIVNGPPGLPLIRLVRSPHEYLADEGLKINAIYYITKAIIPPLNRCFLLIGADVNEWFADLPRKHIALPTISTLTSSNRFLQDSKKSTISQYFASSNCIIDCGRHTKAGICNTCMQDSQKCTTVLAQKIAKLERGYFLTNKLCQSCCGRLNNIKCCSLDCPVLFVANLKTRERKQVQHFENIFKERFSEYSF